MILLIQHVLLRIIREQVKRAYIFDSKDLGLSSYDLNKDGWIKGGTYSPVALTFEVEIMVKLKVELIILNLILCGIVMLKLYLGMIVL